jgi:rod shape-determining protein MreC
MALLDIRQRAGYLFLAVTVGLVILISAQINTRAGHPFLESVTFGVFAEVQRLMTGVTSGTAGFWSAYVDLRGVHAENQLLRQQLADAQIEVQKLRGMAHRSRGFEQLLELRASVDVETSAAEVVGAAATPDFRTLTINKGTNDGIQPNMAVIAPAGVVGRIVVPSGRAAKVQLLVDRNAAAGALIERSRAQGVVVGIGEDLLRLEFVADLADVVVGDAVVTSGIDGIFPKGFTIGHVESLDKAGGGYREIVVRPAVDFSSLEEVLVVLTPTGAERDAETTR